MLVMHMCNQCKKASETRAQTPPSEIERRGVIVWSPPWDVRGWEVTEGFWNKWGFLMKGCDDVLEATNYWRGQRGEEPLVFEL